MYAKNLPLFICDSFKGNERLFVSFGEVQCRFKTILYIFFVTTVWTFQPKCEILFVSWSDQILESKKVDFNKKSIANGRYAECQLPIILKFNTQPTENFSRQSSCFPRGEVKTLLGYWILLFEVYVSVKWLWFPVRLVLNNKTKGKSCQHTALKMYPLCSTNPVANAFNDKLLKICFLSVVMQNLLSMPKLSFAQDFRLLLRTNIEKFDAKVET